MKTLIIIILLVPLCLSAQTRKSKTGWRVISSVGLLAGETDTRPTFQLSGGVMKKRHFFGAGIGYELYRFNTLPVYADWRMDFGRRRGGFIYGNAGYSIAGHQKKTEEFFPVSVSYKGGIFMDAGIGFKLRLGSMNRLGFSAGYSRKDFKHIKRFPAPCFDGNCPEDKTVLNYNLGRIVAKLNWELGY
jgi:hypothetical protein